MARKATRKIDIGHFGDQYLMFEDLNQAARGNIAEVFDAQIARSIPALRDRKYMFQNMQARRISERVCESIRDGKLTS